MKNYVLVLMFAVAPLLGATYTHQGGDFSFQFDDTWELSKKWDSKEVEGQNPYESLVAIQKKTADQDYHTRFSVVREDASRFMKEKDPLGAYQQYALKFLESQAFGNVQVVRGRELLPKLKREAIETVASQRSFGLTFKQVIFLDGKYAYLLTAAVRREKFQSEKKEIDPLFQSFTLAK
ncbi:MAG: hypothetical protein KDD39_08910 [Bdellovibrionales bacterium]|nr:hypothetical protein [Bdellovibrionales bacterium]